MKTFNKVHDFIANGLIYPTSAAFVVGIVSVMIYVFTGYEPLMLAYVAIALSVITALWLVAFFVITVINAVFVWREEHNQEEELSNEETSYY